MSSAVPASPVEAEARGQEFIEATFRGGTFRLPLDVDSWPLDAVARSIGMHPQTHELGINHVHLVTALRSLLGEQWPTFLQSAPKRKHFTAASNVFAAAVGIPADDGDLVFGAIPRLLARLAQFPDFIESDLDRFWGIDYRDRWRFKAGQRRLTLRQIHARINRPPRESSLAIALNDGKVLLTDAAIAVMDLQFTLTGRRHPSRPMTKEQQRERDEKAAQDAKARSAHQERMNKRRRNLSALDNARENARRTQGEAHAQEQAI